MTQTFAGFYARQPVAVLDMNQENPKWNLRQYRENLPQGEGGNYNPSPQPGFAPMTYDGKIGEYK